MASPNPVAPTPPAAPSSAHVSTAEAVASANAPSGVTTHTKINSLQDLKKKAPQVYKMMMEGIAMNICNEMRSHQERLKKMMREGENS